MSRYYEAYDNRYRQIHKKDLSWFSENPSPIVEEILKKYGLSKTDSFPTIPYAVVKAGV